MASHAAEAPQWTPDVDPPRVEHIWPDDTAGVDHELLTVALSRRQYDRLRSRAVAAGVGLEELLARELGRIVGP